MAGNYMYNSSDTGTIQQNKKHRLHNQETEQIHNNAATINAKCDNVK